MTKRPNIIFIQNDHQAHYRWGWDDGPKPMRPNFENLAKEGVEFTNAYCATPLCGPTRRTMLTGLYAHTHGQIHNYTDPPYNHEVYLDTLAESGYKNHYYGKWHAGPGAANDHNCEGFSATDYNNPYLWDSYKEYLKKNSLPQAVHKITKVFNVPHFDDDGFFDKLEEGVEYMCESSWCGEHSTGITTTPKDTHEAFFLVNSACEKLEELAKDKHRSEPFSMRVDFWGPHQPYFPTQEFLDMYPKEHFKLPVYGSLHDDLLNRPAFYKRERSSPFGKNDTILHPSPLEWEEWTEIVRYCYAHITMIDAAAGRLISKIKELGLDENTLIIYTTDHGDALASHGGHFDKGSYMTQEVMRIPFAMSWKDKIEPGQILDEYISTVDFPVTILDAAGLKFTKNKVHGKSILPLAKKQSDIKWRDSVFSETYGHGYGEEIISRMVVREPYKYIANNGFIHELYDLEADPFEMSNLVNNPEYTSVLKDMTSVLSEWQQLTDDTVVMT